MAWRDLKTSLAVVLFFSVHSAEIITTLYSVVSKRLLTDVTRVCTVHTVLMIFLSSKGLRIG